MQSGESLTDVAQGCVWRERRWGWRGRERERDRLLSSTLQYTSVLPRRESTPWLTSRESKRERRGVCSPTSNWVSTPLSPLHLISSWQIALIDAINGSVHAFGTTPDQMYWTDIGFYKNLSIALFLSWLKLLEIELMYAAVKVEHRIFIYIRGFWTNLMHVQTPYPQHWHFREKSEWH